MLRNRGTVTKTPTEMVFTGSIWGSEPCRVRTVLRNKKWEINREVACNRRLGLPRRSTGYGKEGRKEVGKERWLFVSQRRGHSDYLHMIYITELIQPFFTQVLAGSHLDLGLPRMTPSDRRVTFWRTAVCLRLADFEARRA
jgi:hypothetical protein